TGLPSVTAVAKLVTGPRSTTTFDLLIGLPMIDFRWSSAILVLHCARVGRPPVQGPARGDTISVASDGRPYRSASHRRPYRSASDGRPLRSPAEEDAAWTMPRSTRTPS